MGASFVPITIFTVFWGVIGIVCPFFAPKGPNRGIIQVVLMLTAATCWLFWLCAYMAQMNPLIGPRLNNETLIWIAHTWEDCAAKYIYNIYNTNGNCTLDIGNYQWAPPNEWNSLREILTSNKQHCPFCDCMSKRVMMLILKNKFRF